MHEKGPDRRPFTLTVTIAALVASVSLTSCSVPPPVRSSEFIGQTMEAVAERLGDREDLTQITQDVSVVVGLEPEFNGDELDSPAWTVLAGCADDDDVNKATVLELAVIPTTEFTPSIAERLAEGEFEDTVVCDFDR